MENRERKGQILKQAREAKGLSLEIVHEATKIPMDILRALEEGYTVRTLTPFYYKGFVKIYAQYLEIELETVLDDYHPEKLPEPAQERKHSFLEEEADFILKQQRMRLIVKGILLVIGLFIIFRIGGCIHRRIKGKGSSKKGVLVDVVNPRRQEKMAKQKTFQKSSAESAPKIDKDQTARKPQALQVVTEISSTKEKKTSILRNINVTVRAKSNSWLKVKADSNIVFQATMKRGTVETWTADTQVEISGRNINKLEFEFNGKLIGSLEREKRKIRKVIFTQNGLSVLQ